MHQSREAWYKHISNATYCLVQRGGVSGPQNSITPWTNRITGLVFDEPGSYSVCYSPSPDVGFVLQDDASLEG